MHKTVKRDTVIFLAEHGFFQPENRVLDIGCGNGRFAASLRTFDVMYYGIDACRSFVKDAMQRFRNDGSRFKFFWCNVANGSYNINGDIDPLTVKFPLKDGVFDNVICHSLFTHLGPYEVAEHYMSEIRRLIKPGGKLWITFFKSPPNDLNYGTDRTVYDQHEIANLLVGFDVELFQGGDTKDYNDQLEFIAVRNEEIASAPKPKKLWEHLRERIHSIIQPAH